MQATDSDLQFGELLAKELGLVQRPIRSEGAPLCRGDGVNAQLAQFEHAIQLSAAERGLFAGSLELDEMPGAGHDQVQINVGVLVFLVIEIEQLRVAT